MTLWSRLCYRIELAPERELRVVDRVLARLEYERLLGRPSVAGDALGAALRDLEAALAAEDAAAGEAAGT